jgi:predicted acetyltransferase
MRGRGLARALLALAVDEAKARGIKVVTLHASKFGKPLYEQNGFEMSNEMRLRD